MEGHKTMPEIVLGSGVDPLEAVREQINRLEGELRSRREERDQLREERDRIVGEAEARGDQTLTPEEAERVGELRATHSRLEAEVSSLEAQLAEVREREQQLTRQQVQEAAAAEVRRVARVTSEPRTYSRDTSLREGRSFFADVYAAQALGDVGAQQRLARHMQEERATTTGSFAGLVVPQYLVEQAAAVARAGRPFADSVNRQPLPSQGTVLQVPVGTTGASAAVQNPENTNVSNTDEVWGNVTVPVVTIAGQQDVSRQALERGTPGIDVIIYQDLVGAYATALDQQVLNGSGSNGQMLGVLNTAGINTSSAYGAAATVTSFYQKAAGGVNQVETTRFMPPTLIAMHPRRWNWLVSQADASNRPLVVPNSAGPQNADGTFDEVRYGRSVGTLLGLPVVTDANIPTNVGTASEDVVIVCRAEDLILWEDGAPRQLRFEQTLGNQLTVKLVVYGYAAFTAARYPSAVAKVGGADTTAGNGQIAPTF